MPDARAKAVTLRKIELAVLGLGMLIALASMLDLGRGAFAANLAWTKGGARVAAFVFTLLSFAIVGAIVVAPYVSLILLGRRIAPDGRAIGVQVGGLAIAAATTAASVYLAYVSADAVHRGAGSTSAVTVVVLPVYLFLASSSVYGVVVWLHRRRR
jgi:hypothetical protein